MVSGALLDLNQLMRRLAREYFLYLLKEFTYVSAKNTALALGILNDSYRLYY